MPIMRQAQVSYACSTLGHRSLFAHTHRYPGAEWLRSGTQAYNPYKLQSDPDDNTPDGLFS